MVPKTLPIKFTAAVDDPTHKTWFATGLTVGVGLTVIVKLCAVPVQVIPAVVYCGVTVTIAIIGDRPVFTAMKLGILPVPLAANPIDGALLVHVNVNAPVGPVVGLVKLIAAVGVPLQTIWLATGFTTGLGFTVMVNVIGVPVQPPALGVTVMVATNGPLVVFVVTNGRISPVPDAARPIAVLSFVQLNVEPGVPLNVIIAVVAPVQYALLLTGVTVGIGFTVMVKVLEGPVQVTPALVKLGVTTMVATTGNAVALIAVKLAILPVPLAANPIEGLELVQL